MSLVVAWGPSALVVVLLLIAAGTDIRGLIIPNWVSVVILALLPVAWFLGAVAPTPKASGLAFAIVAAATLALWFSGRFGGGDVKLLSATAAWAGLGHLLDLLMVTAMAGGVVSLLVIIFHRLPADSALCRLPLFRTLAENRTFVPYGVAIMVGGVTVVIDAARHLP